ncbi:CBN-WRT-6 protein [Aphelenchoides besseyi]|nr:CBN-WRT-6 protein [Aphelenchoides besseyi]KAI6201129.1 CBN-WRT-6 protein [Aphelenchoides besseyi]
MRLRCALLLLVSLPVAIGQNSCGRESIPYMISVDLAGKPELGCDTPACFGPLKNTELDEYDEETGKHHKMHLSAYERTATCAGKFTELACMANDEWTGGVAEFNNGTHIILTMECCQFQGLNYATEYKTLVLRPGDRYVGGAVKDKNRLIAFDLIKEVMKNVTSQNEIQYIVNVYRMSCVPEPSRLLNKVDANLQSGEFLSKQLSGGSKLRNYELSRDRNLEKGHHSGSITHNQSPQMDYDYSRERSSSRVRPSYRSSHPYTSNGRSRYNRRRFYRPVIDEYDYYEMEPVPFYRRAMYKRLRSRYDQEQLWPIAYLSKSKNRAQGLRSFNNDASKVLLNNKTKEYPEFTGADNKLPAIYTETTATSVIPAPQRESRVQPAVQSGVPLSATYPIAPTYAVQSSYPSHSVVPQNNYVQSGVPTAYSSYDTSSSGGCADSCTTSTCSCSMNGMFSSLQCFSGKMLVTTPSGQKRMDELEAGELVMSVEGSMITFSPVVMFLHRKPDEYATYIYMQTSTGNSLKITDQHLIYVSKCKSGERIRLIRAQSVQVGDCVHVVSDIVLQSTRVVSIERVRELGIFAPLTASGDIVVNSILASCHSNLAMQTLQQTFFSWWRSANSWTRQFASVLDPIFGFSRIDSAANKETRINDAELPLGVEYLLTVVELFIPKTMFV